MVLILGNDPDRRTRLGGILSARHGPNGTTLDRPSAILGSTHLAMHQQTHLFQGSN